MTLYEVEQYYGKSYTKIIGALKPLVDTFIFDVDKVAGKYLSVVCVDKYAQKSLEIRHSSSNDNPYTTWYRDCDSHSIVNKNFKNQKDVAEYINELLW